MNKGKKSRKLLFIATALTIAALVSVLVAYAAVTLFTVTGGNVTVVGVSQGTIYYSNTNSGTPTWTTTLQPTGSWYAELVINGNSVYKGAVTITWQLQTDASGSWQYVSGASVVTTGVSLTGGSQTIYAATDGTLANAVDWSTNATGGTYQITATVASAQS
ncbi:MAG TPA: hypothetical protein VK536_01705 [Candidatus Limnocylindrales bacterium]|nr:hypothetical protein [Candidatus Limnocylindrales bacterium]